MAHVKSWLTKPWVVMPLVAVVVLGGWAMFFRSSASGTGTVQTTDQVVAATSGSIAETVSAQGTVAATQTDNLNFASSGTVTAVNVKAGQQVSTGDVLAQIDSSALQASLSQAQASAAQAAAKLSDDEAAGASSAQIAADETSVATANDKVTTAQTALDGAQLVATFDGTVSQVNLTVGEQLGNSGASGTTTTGTQSPSGGSTSNLGSGSGGSNATQNASANGTTRATRVRAPLLRSRRSPRRRSRLTSGSTAPTSPRSPTASRRRSRCPPRPATPSGAVRRRRLPRWWPIHRRRFPRVAVVTGPVAVAVATVPRRAATPRRRRHVERDRFRDRRRAVAQVTSGVGEVPGDGVVHRPVGHVQPGRDGCRETSPTPRQNAVQVPTLAITTNNGVSTVTVSKNGSTEIAR